MIGRGAIGRPWLLADVSAAQRNKPAAPRPQGPALAEVVAAHADAALRFYGSEVGIRTLRKHLDGYLALVPGSACLRGRLIRETDPSSLFAGIAELGQLDLETLARAA
ncbi:MAG: tRNA-dihydrouridine synthase [Pseudomonadota bacterium]